MLSQVVRVNMGLKCASIIRLAILVPSLAAMGQGAMIAQVIPDRTLSKPSVVKNSDSTATITGGTKAGSNLFHSFSQFSVPSGKTAFFDNSSTINNIITRVTGGNLSSIYGEIETNGTANLFLINPNGILFGPGASLKIGGSFVASTANSFSFADGLEYSAINPQAAPLLAVNVPVGLQFGKEAQPIIVTGSYPTVSLLSVQPGKTLALVGGDINIEGEYLYTPGGRIDLGGVSDAGTVGLTFNSNIPSLNFSKDIAQSNILLSNSILTVVGLGSGDIALNAQNINIFNSILSSGLLSGTGSNAGNITLTALEKVTVAGSHIYSFVPEQVTGNGGNISIFARSLMLTNDATILSSTNGGGNAGNITFFVKDSVFLDGSTTLIGSTSESSASGDSGNISIFSKTLNLDNGSSIVNGTFGEGDAGNISINSTSAVNLDGADFARIGGIFIIVDKNSVGNAGDINISTSTLSVTNGDLIGSNSGKGTSGDIFVAASESIHLDGFRLKTDEIVPSGITNIPFLGEGGAGKIVLDTKSLFLTNGAVISALQTGAQKTGNIDIVATKLVNISGSSQSGHPSFIISSTYTNLPGGDIKINTPVLNIVGSGSGIFAGTDDKSTGKGGNIFIEGNAFINSPTVAVADSAAISANSLGKGKGGNVNLQANSLTLDNGRISAATNSNNGGLVKLDVQNLLLANNKSTISATAGKSGKGGNVNINAGFTVLNNNSDITANAFEGEGGKVDITTQGLFQSRDSEITASSSKGINGTVQFNITNLDPSRGLFSLPETIVDATGLVSQKCDATIRKESPQSQFVITGRGGIQHNPSESLQDESILSDWATLQPQTAKPPKQPSVTLAPPTQEKDGIAIAQGWKVDADGTIVLTAEPTSTTVTPTWQSKVKCRA